MADLSIDASRYTRAPRISAATGLSLGNQLIQNMPAAPLESIASAAARIARRVSLLSEAFGGGPDTGARPHQVDPRIDRAWGSVEKRLRAADGLSEEVDRVDRERAAVLYAKFFADGLSFLTLEYMVEHAESEKRMAWIVGEVEADLIRLVGANYITNLRAAHAAYGQALGITAPRDADEAKLAAPLRALSDAIANYSLQIVGWYSNLDETAPDYATSVAAVRKALAPIDKFRDGRGGTEGGAAGV